RSRASSPNHWRRSGGVAWQTTVTASLVLTVDRRPSPGPRGRRPRRAGAPSGSGARTRAAPRWRRGAARPGRAPRDGRATEAVRPGIGRGARADDTGRRGGAAALRPYGLAAPIVRERVDSE